MMPYFSINVPKRAQKRIDGELVFGNQISVGFPQRISCRNDWQMNGQGDGSFFQNPPSNGSNGFWPLGGGMCGMSNNWWKGSNVESKSSDKMYGNIQRPQPKFGTALNNQENISNSVRAWDEAPWIWHYSSEDAANQLKGRSILSNKNEKNVEDNILNTYLPSNLNADSVISKGTNTSMKIQPPYEDSTAPESTFKVEAILKRSRVTSPKPLRRSLDSMRLPQKPTSTSSGGRKCRTPSPYTLLNSSGPENSALPRNVLSFSNESLENEKFFHPIPSNNSENTPVELHVTNLDQNINPLEMKSLLLSIFGEHVVVLHINVFIQSDGNFAASVKVRSLQDAQFAISKLHRKKIGFKRIMICYAHSSQPQNPQFIRWQIVSLLQEVPGCKLPLFKFIELYESRYLFKVSVSDLYKLKDVCIITDESIGRMISLNPDHRSTPSPNLVPQDIEPYCSVHYKGIQCSNKGWAEQEAIPLPNVNEPLPKFSSNILKLLNSHNNILPLVSLCDCYEALCGKLNICEVGVPLEHYVTCVSNVELALTNGIKYLKSVVNPTQEDKKEDVTKSVSPSLVNQLNLFGRELVDLLKTQSHCQLVFSKFIPAYHHHFGRQCRVADYGFTKLIELLEALPNVVQVLGEGNKRIVTLSHRAQVRRFTSELLRVLKTQPWKRMSVSELPALFERVLNRPFDPTDYGFCRLDDLVDQLPESTVLIEKTGSPSTTTLAIPKREQTSQEAERTRLFAKEVVELLSLAPQCSISFNKFIPAYHHHYGHQCRLADFGFSKLIELFEALPDIVKLDEDSEGERRVTLALGQRVKVLSEQISDLVTVRYPPGLPLSSLASAYLWQFGYALKPEHYEAESLLDLVASINTVEVVELESGLTLVPMDHAKVKDLSNKVLHLLMDSPNGKLSLSEIKSHFNKCYHHYFTKEQLKSFLGECVQIDIVFGLDGYIELNLLYQFARKVYHILLKSEGWKLTLSSLEEKFLKTYSVPIQPQLYGFSSVAALLGAIPKIVTLRGKRPKRAAILNKDFISRKVQEESLSTNVDSSVKISNGANGHPDNFFNAEDTDGFEHWGDVWGNGSILESYDSQVPVVTLPQLTTPPKNIMSTSALISPCKNLLPANAHPMLHTEPLPYLMAPDPSELPIPKQYLSPIFEAARCD